MACVKKCCCCCQLRTGVTVLGWIGMVLALFHLTAVSAVYANLHNIVAKFDFADQHLTISVESGLGSSLPIAITGAVISVVSCILLAWGASIGNRFMLLPWLILEMISIIILGIIVLIGGIMCFAIEDMGVGLGIVILVFGGLFVAIHIYIWICVLSCFQELRDTQTIEENTLLEMPKSLENIIVDYRPPEYARLENDPKVG